MSGMIAFKKADWEEQMARVYQAGFAAGQASRTTHKWPTELKVGEAALEYVSGFFTSDDMLMAVRKAGNMSFIAGVQWLKSYLMEKENEK